MGSTTIKYGITKETVKFSEIQEREFFYIGNNIYVKLRYVEIKTENAINVETFKLAFFQPDEAVTKVVRTIKH